MAKGSKGSNSRLVLTYFLALCCFQVLFLGLYGWSSSRKDGAPSEQVSLTDSQIRAFQQMLKDEHATSEITEQAVTRAGEIALTEPSPREEVLTDIFFKRNKPYIPGKSS